VERRLASLVDLVGIGSGGEQEAQTFRMLAVEHVF
jgi:hypothetical protein